MTGGLSTPSQQAQHSVALINSYANALVTPVFSARFAYWLAAMEQWTPWIIGLAPQIPIPRLLRTAQPSYTRTGQDRADETKHGCLLPMADGATLARPGPDLRPTSSSRDLPLIVQLHP